MTIFIDNTGLAANGASDAEVLRAMAQFQARVALDAVTVLTDNSAGSADADYDVTAAAVDSVNAANSGTNLAQKAATEAALVTVQDAVRELFAKANEAAGKVGVSTVTYNGGGASTDGTIAAITVSTTAATTGTPAAGFNAVVAALNEALYNVAVLTNKVATAAGVAPLRIGYSGTLVSTVASISTGTGTAADPAVTKAAADAVLAALAANVATIAGRLNAALAGPGNAPVVAV